MLASTIAKCYKDLLIPKEPCYNKRLDKSMFKALVKLDGLGPLLDFLVERQSYNNPFIVLKRNKWLIRSKTDNSKTINQ